MFEFIDLDVRGPVGWYRFSRPPRNAFHWEMLHETVPAFQELEAREDVRVIVLASALERHFSVGADIESFNGVTGERMADWVEATHRLARAIRGSAKPVLAAIHGTAVGGGLEMTYHADLRFAAADARLGQPEINIAFIPPVAGTQALVRLVGRANAFRILTEGELMDAEAAREIGLVDVVVPPERLIDEVQSHAEMLAGRPANALAAIRRCLIDGGDDTFAEGMAIEAAAATALADHPNFAEGVAAFLARRPPRWL